MSSRRRLGMALWLLLLMGCGADLAIGGGPEARTGHAVAFGRVAVATKLGTPTNDHGFMLGMALESRGEQSVGSRWDSGVIVGWGTGPAAIDGRIGREAYGEFGTPLRGTLWDRGAFYTGAVLAMPIHFGSPRQVIDLNQSTWILRQRFELVPLLRVRFHVDPPVGPHANLRTDLALGVAFRLRAFSDLL
jgi:hypothetical protein